MLDEMILAGMYHPLKKWYAKERQTQEKDARPDISPHWPHKKKKPETETREHKERYKRHYRGTV